MSRACRTTVQRRRGFYSYPSTGRTGWTRYSRGLSNRKTHAIVTHGGALYACADDGVFKSPTSPNPGADGVWVRVSNCLTNLVTRALAVDTSAAPPALYAGADGAEYFIVGRG